MKKYWILLFATVAALVSCGKEIEDPDPVDVDISVGSGAFSFNLDATYPTISQARKQGWEEDDAVFVFFSGVAAPKHLKMTYSNSSWTSAEYDGATQSTGALGLKNGDTRIYHCRKQGQRLFRHGDSRGLCTTWVLLMMIAKM